MRVEELEHKPCPRTKSTMCECAGVNSLSEAEATINATSELIHSDNVKGTIKFTQEPGGPTVITGEITGVEPGEHGFHIHEFGDLSGGCDTAGAHYNPDNVDHGDLYEGHVGDLGNVTADENGVVTLNVTAPRVDLSGDRSVVGRSIIIHSDRDDLGLGGNPESLKTGNAGERLACGVITLAE